ncbi:hypothetical protein H8S44_02825 [Anaerosacchariphilus sp. NSJ-68]|uniref:SH3 domain-containing protein n=2 Tax=Lachnospiraceae TaxID=186803 RepID=A0A923LAH0_9FIRM|nr:MULTISPECIES: hypothetical protein [Lachnospiraceae]MBC5658707.1 hypothetical protein [Anaerosacchariphilus hominis]MBC5699024.1 hypothetical protein [Roseburia difficilis]
MKNTIKVDTSSATIEKSMTKMLEASKRLSNSLAVTVNEIMKSNAKYSQDRMFELTEVMRKTMNSYVKINTAYLTNSMFSDLIKNTMESLVESFKEYEKIDISKSARAMAESMNKISKNIATEQLRQLQQIDFSTVFANIISESTSFLEIIGAAYDVVRGEDEEKIGKSDLFTEEEMREALSEQVTNPKGFQTRVSEWSEKKKVQFFIAWQLICFIYANFLQPYFTEKIGMPVTTYVVSNVKELPEKGARIVGQIQENIEAIIVENTNYYYKITFTDENGETKEGYVAKRNLKIVEYKKEENVNEKSAPDNDTETK